MRLALIAAMGLVGTHFSAVAQWRYDEEKDRMGRGVIKHAMVESDNQVQFGFPYGGPQRANLYLRIHPQHGRDVALKLEKAHFLCRMDGCSVLVRFDEGKPTRFSASEPSDHSTTTIFIRDYARFVAGLRGARTVRIEAPFYQEATRIFEFNVAGLNWEAPAKPRPKEPTPSERLRACNQEAGSKALSGKERSDFILACTRA